MTDGTQATIFSFLMLITNIVLVLVIFIDTRRTKTLRKLKSMRTQQRTREKRQSTVVLEMRNVYAPSMTSAVSGDSLDGMGFNKYGVDLFGETPVLSKGTSFRNPMCADQEQQQRYWLTGILQSLRRRPTASEYISP